MKPVIIDCDPGVDDAVAILLANKLPEFNILAITTVAGNVSLERTTYNALGLAEFIGLDVPVYRGAAGPMFRERWMPQKHTAMTAWRELILRIVVRS